jgi:SSS family solute:Na+ symporter
MKLSPYDVLIILVPLAFVLGISIYLKRYMRSVADFLAASRCAGRYLICTALAETGSSVMLLITALEVFSKTGFSLNFWNTARDIIFFFVAVFGLVVYRFRETRALTFHQFFEMRYSRGLRVFASFLAVFSGIFNFGVQPAVGARFFVYFCDLPRHMLIGPLHVPTYVVIMFVLMGISLYFALSGGQISVMITDCIEGVISGFFYLIIAIFIICTISVSQMHDALTSGVPGASFVDPFEIGGRQDFNGIYILLSIALSFYYYRGTAWQQGFAAAAKTAHEGRMAQILGNWRGYSYIAMSVLISIAAFTVLHHADFAPQQAMVRDGLETIENAQLRTQMSMPMALGAFLAPGVKGCLLSILLFGLLAAQGVQLHGHGSTILQDVIMPLRKKPFEPRAHVRWLKVTVFCVAAFACSFSIIFKPVDYLVMIVALIGAIYLGGIGFVVWGGLYWKRGTNAGAWTAMIIGSSLGVTFNIV